MQAEILEYALLLPAVVLALTIHEFAHAVTAYKLGDETPKLMGRVSLNPLVHLDLMGFICFVFLRFGWAKPVRINPQNFKKPGRDDTLVTMAGPFSNLFLALFFTLLLKLFLPDSNSLEAAGTGYTIFLSFIIINIQVNLILFLFNMIPIPPLDGSKLLLLALPASLQKYKLLYMRYGFFIFIFFLLFISFVQPNWLGNVLAKMMEILFALFRIGL